VVLTARVRRRLRAKVRRVSYDAVGDYFVAAVSEVGGIDVRAAYPRERDGLVDVQGMPVTLVVKDSPPKATPETTVLGDSGLNTYSNGVFMPMCTGGVYGAHGDSSGTIDGGSLPKFTLLWK